MNESLNTFLMNEDDLFPLGKWTKGVNVFDIIRNAKTEIRHSNMLAWLLNANGSHGFGDAFVRRFVKSVIRRNEPEKIADWAFLNCDNQIVKNEENHMDILIRFESGEKKSLIVIENKLFSSEHTSGKSKKMQTEKYREVANEGYPGYQKMFVYLTPGGAAPDDSNWYTLSYEEILEDILAVSSQFETSSHVKMIIDDYCEMIRRDVICDDSELFDVCNGIYAKHAAAIETLFRWKNSDKTTKKQKMMSNQEENALCEKIYNRYPKELDLIFANRVNERAVLAEKLRSWNMGVLDEQASGRIYVRYTMSEIDELLPVLDQPNGSWNTKHTYYFWFGTYDYGSETETQKVWFIFELGLKNTTSEIKEKQAKIIQAMGCNPRMSERYKRVKSISIEKNGEKSMDEFVARVFKEASRYASEWCGKIQENLK